MPISTPPEASFTSAAQAITQAGILTIAHGLGVAPTRVQCWLKCLTAMNGYAINDLAFVATYVQANGQGCGVSPDATNLVVNYGNNLTVFVLPDKATGSQFSATNANWNFFIKAWK